MYIERVVHVSETDKEVYNRIIKEYTEKFEQADFDYNIIESRYNGEPGCGYKAELPYGFWVDDSDYDC